MNNNRLERGETDSIRLDDIYGIDTGSLEPLLDPPERSRIDDQDMVQGVGTLFEIAPPEPSYAVSQENNTSTPPWGKYKRFFPIAEAFSNMSKMPGTKVGCIVLGYGCEVLTSGWNGSPRFCKADEDSRLSTRKSRLDWVVHAESNAIANAARSGTSLLGGVLITTKMPCMTCAKLIVQAGISAIITPRNNDPRWSNDTLNALALFREVGVDVEWIE